MPEEMQEFVLSEVQDLPTSREVLPLMGRNQTLLMDVLKLLVREASKLSSGYSKAVSEGDCKAARRAIHTLKSNVSQFGLENFSSVAGKIEIAAIEEKLDFLVEAQPIVDELAARTRLWATGIIEES